MSRRLRRVRASPKKPLETPDSCEVGNCKTDVEADGLQRGVVAACYDELQGGLFRGIPHVWMDPPVGRVAPEDSFVVHDGDAAVELAVKELARLGVSHFAAVGDHPRRLWSGLRLGAFRRQVRGRGTFAELELTKQDSGFLLSKDKVARVRQIEPWLKRLPKPCGVFAVCDRIGVDDVVRHMGCSRRLAMMKYLAATGRSIFAEIREAQFEKVLVLLSRRDIQLGAIADRCGWKSPTALRAYFEKRLGMTMREWRARNAAS